MKTVKKVTALVLCLCMMLGLFGTTAFAATECDCDELPIIYVKGRSTVFKDKDKKETPLPDIDKSKLPNYIKPILPLLAKGYFTGDYSEYGNELTKLFEELYADFSPDAEGNFPGNSGNNYDPRVFYRDVHKRKPAEGDLPGATAHLMSYVFEYDFRDSPWDIADDLHIFIQNIKRVTGHNTYNMVARCLGSCIASAYFAKYGWSDINSVVIYNPTNNGTVVTNAFFTGKLSLNVDSIDYFVNQNVETEEMLLQFLITSLDMLNSVYGLRLTAAALSAEVNKIAAVCAPACTRASYGTMFGYWAMVGPENYEAARSFVFPGEYAVEYAKIIEKTDEYYYNVASKLPEIYKAMAADGVKMKFIAKYGFQAYPVSEEAREQSDMIITLRQQTFGATSAYNGKILSLQYLKNAEKNGTAKYISPDKIVDCSTALFPDTTWVIKDFTHNCFPSSVDVMILKLFENDANTTVWDNAEYPQYIVMDKAQESISPMTEKNLGSKTGNHFLVTLTVFLVRLAEVFANLFEIITGIITKF